MRVAQIQLAGLRAQVGGESARGKRSQNTQHTEQPVKRFYLEKLFEKTIIRVAFYELCIL